MRLKALCCRRAYRFANTQPDPTAFKSFLNWDYLHEDSSGQASAVQADTSSPCDFSESRRCCTYFMHIKSKIAYSIVSTRFMDHLVSCLPENCLALRARKVNKRRERPVKPTSPGEFQASGAETLTLAFLAVPGIPQKCQPSNLESSGLLSTNDKWL